MRHEEYLILNVMQFGSRKSYPGAGQGFDKGVVNFLGCEGVGVNENISILMGKKYKYIN